MIHVIIIIEKEIWKVHIFISAEKLAEPQKKAKDFMGLKTNIHVELIFMLKRPFIIYSGRVHMVGMS